ncbi:LuxR C-terminal-related transcriptional regulator [Actinomadura sp. DC4]|uniref:helix-turn-helix transcriptional regulator n=1 Tax=Actinomadura sp. DC4 TaxID=3055069 RepID=UPI0025B00F93|nr:LuxR C-terminal-related transcriptional regulator [Actinomadura sp. DC4]MDN3356444.1 LuxR C-terminal-related transcriptional regulator [Actinomadura sp. DC4]
MGDPVRVSVVALDPMLQAGATSALLGSPDVVVVPPQEAAEVSVVVVDGIGDQVFDLLHAQRGLADRPEVVLIATDFTPAEALHAIATGARGLVRRCEADAERLGRAVSAAACGDCTVPPDMLSLLLDHEEGPASRSQWPGAGLSKREHAVLALIADGRETDEIARELCYSARTVVGVVHDITHRFRLRNRAHAVAYALRTGLL